MRQLIANRFEILPGQLLGQGGMGTVYMGIDTVTQETVAIKQLKPEVVMRNPEALERFMIEGRTLRQLNHPNIVKLLGSDEFDEHQYLVMEYVGGGSLRDLLEKQSRLSIQRSLYIALDLADALTRAHRLDILHRDIKPENVMLADDGTPRLTDFGMALVAQTHVTQSGAIVGTLAYLSPEALNNEMLDERTDIWAFGVMLFEMLAGQLPFTGKGVGAIVNAILTRPTPDLEALRPELPPAMVDLVYRMLEKERHLRIPSIRLVGAELEALIRGTTVSGRVQLIADSTGRFELSTPALIKLAEAQPEHPNNIPLQPSAFIGRGEELAELALMMTNPQNRLITLVGPGGVGKTRIAMEAAERALDSFQDGVFVVPLAPLEDTAMVAPAIAEAVNFAFGGTEDPRTELTHYLREKHLMLILDNFEHLIGASDFISQLIASAPRLQIVVTSRERLRLRGESVLEIDGMPLPSPSTKADKSLEYPVIQLFLQSARRVVPDFDITDENVRDVLSICHLVQGLPLGVELAASWLESLRADEIIDEIERSLDFLETDLRDVPERHRSMRAAFDYSWNLMSDEERSTFMQLSVFRGGFDRSAAQSITNASLRTLTNLVNKSLLHREPSGRYRMNLLLRQYAEERLHQTTVTADVRSHHAHYYADYVAKVQPTFGTRKERAALEAIEDEFENIMSAWRWASDTATWDVIDKMLHTMLLFYQGRSRIRECVETFGALSNHLQELGLGDTDLYWRARVRQMWLGARLGDYAKTVAYATAAWRHFEDANNPIESAFALNTLAYGLMMQGQHDDAIQSGKLALERTENAKFHEQWYTTRANLGYALYLAGCYDEAIELYNTMYPENDDERDYSPMGYAFGVNNVGEIKRAQGKLEEARAMFEEAYEVFKTYNARRGMAFTLNNLAGVDFVTGHYDRAKANYEEAYLLNKETGDMSGIAHSLSALGNTAFFAGDSDSAKRYYQDSLRIRQQIGSQMGIADSMEDLGRTAMAMSSYEEALRYFDQSLAIRQALNDQPGVISLLTGKAFTVLMMGQIDEAHPIFEQTLISGRGMNDSWVVCQALEGLGEVAMARGDYDLAAQYFHESLQVNRSLGVAAFGLLCVVNLATIEEHRGHREQALLLNTIVAEHPELQNFIPITRTRALALDERLTKALPANVVTLVKQRSRQWTLDTMIETILKNNPRLSEMA